MRVLWVISANERAGKGFASPLAKELTSVEYQIRQANSVDEIPNEHLSDPGVVVVLDAFCPLHPGFEGVKRLRELSFAGAVFLAGEPAPENAPEYFKLYGLSGYFTSFDRIDYPLAAGIIHTQLHYDGTVNLQQFLVPGGRHSSEKIKTPKEFSLFVDTLSAFVGRFGIDSKHLQKILMGLTLGHMKTGPEGPSFDSPFEIQFGVDRSKLLIATRAFSKGSTLDVVLNEFCDALASIKSDHGHRASLFPDFQHVSRSAESLIVFLGSAKGGADNLDPMTLLTILPFPNVKGQKAAANYWFTFAHVTPTEEIPDSLAQLPKRIPGANKTAGTDKKVVAASNQTPASTTASTTPEVQRAPEGVIEAIDLNKILADPEIIGDNPADLAAKLEALNQEKVAAVPGAPVLQASAKTNAPGSNVVNLDSAPSAAASAMVPEGKAQELQSEIDRLRALNVAMGEDIRRLMKERREPTTDRELRDMKAVLDEKVRRLSLENAKFAEEIAKKTSEIDELKEKLAALKKEIAA